MTKNFLITSLDEEVGLVEKNSNYLQARYSNKSLEMTDRVFTWGKFDYDNLSNKFKKHKKKFIKSGNPRIDFWRKDFEFFYKKRKLKYNNYILFTLNFSHLVSKAEFNKFLKFLVETKYVDRGYTIDITKKRQQDSYKMYKKF